MELTKDLFGQILQDYNQLKRRAEEIFEIYGEHFNTEKQYVETIDIDMFTVEITTSWYSYGEHNNDYHSFPASLLLGTTEEAHQYFRGEKIRIAEQTAREKAEQERKERERTERYEREQLAKLLTKYGGQ